MSAVPQRALAPVLAPLRAESRALTGLPLTAFALDVVALTATVLLAAYGRDHLVLFGSTAMVQGSVVRVAAPLVIGWLLLIGLRGGYEQGVFGAGADEYKAVVGASLMAGAMLGIGCYLTKYQLSRGFFLFAFVLGPVILTVGRYSLRGWIHRARRVGAFQQRR